MNKRYKVYIASPYSIGDVGKNVKRQMDVFNSLLELGFVPFAPLLTHYQHIVYPQSYDTWLSYDLEWLASCDVVLRLEGVSPGADKEIAVAKELGIPIFYSVKDIVKNYGRSIHTT